MFRQDRTNPSTAISNWRGRLDSKKGWPSTAVSSWLNGGLFGGAATGAIYFCGGATTPWGELDTITKFSFLDDTRTVLTATLSAGVYDAGGAGNAGVAGYFMGGIRSSGGTAVIDKLDFSAETVAALGTGLSSARASFGVATNNAVAALTGGGTGYVDTVDKLTFPGDTRTTLGTGLSAGVTQSMGMANSGTAGYFAIGVEPSGRVTTVDKFAFPGDTRTTLGTGTSVSGGGGAGLSSKDVAGYMCQGYTTTYSAVADKFAFPSDSRSTIASRTAASGWLGGGSNQGTAGYVAGGEVSGGGKVDTVDKLDYSAESWSVLSPGLVVVTAFGPTGLENSVSLL